MTRVTVEQVEAAQAAPNIEQAADLAALQAAADAAPLPPGAEPPPPEPPPIDLASEIAQALAIVAAILGPALPSLREIYTDATTAAAGAAIAGVCNKHGWLQGGVLGRWGEEIACLAVCGPLAVATATGVKGDLAKLKAKADAAKLQHEPGAALFAPAAAASAPASSPGKMVQFGNVPA